MNDATQVDEVKPERGEDESEIDYINRLATERQEAAFEKEQERRDAAQRARVPSADELRERGRQLDADYSVLETEREEFEAKVENSNVDMSEREAFTKATEDLAAEREAFEQEKAAWVEAHPDGDGEPPVE